ncbi:MAG: M28 family peptidase [Polyangiaceae bacterium]
MRRPDSRLHPAVPLLALASLSLLSCASTPPDQHATASSSATTPKSEPPKEPHLANLRQLTFGGENAEAYWANSGAELIMQSRSGDQQCDQIVRLNVADPTKRIPVSSGKGATTCSYFLPPNDNDVIYASTHLGGDACPPKPDHSQGYVWALYDTYDIFRAKADGTGVTRLTDTPGYDAEGTVCSKDGSIIFTSVRDGDIDLYRMDADGKNVKRLTNTPGYDGGAFFNADCTKIVWRASRPHGKDLEDFRALLAKHLVRPTKLELYVANADGTDPVQVTYLNSASFAPFFFPDGKRIAFSSNYGDPKGREFDIWAINVDGTGLERITTSPGFDGFPMFSPDGKRLAFSSNRNTPEGSHDTNVFVADWVAGSVAAETRGPDRVAADAQWLADPVREGRGVGTSGLEASGAYIEARFKELGLEPAGENGSYRQAFDVTVSVEGAAGLTVDGAKIEGAKPLSFSSPADAVEGDLVLAGYGIKDDALGRDDFKGINLKDKIAVLRRYVPEDPAFDKVDVKRKNGDLRRKAWLAREAGAKAVVIVDVPERPKKAPKNWAPPDEGKMPGLSPDTNGALGIPALIAPRAAMASIVEKLEKGKGKPVRAHLDVALTPTKKPAFNVIAKLSATGAAKKQGAIVIGAHYDHLGHGGEGSLAPGEDAIHPGADDNASGTATVLEIARLLKQGPALDRDVYLVTFSGEERGLLGSNYLTKNPPPGLDPKELFAMINLDMVGRVRQNQLDIVGHDTATEFDNIVKASCEERRVECRLAEGGGYGPSDHSSFYGAGVPVLFLFSGTHADYHKPSDTPEKLNYAGMAQVAELVQSFTQTLAARDGKLTYKSVPTPAPRGDTRTFGASLGTIPDYAGSDGASGVLLSGVRPGGAAEQAGMQRGDLLVQVGEHQVHSVEDLMYVLAEAKPGQKAKAVVMRNGQRVELEVTFQGPKPH